MTHLSDKEHKRQMADMKAFDEPMPFIGTLVMAGLVICKLLT